MKINTGNLYAVSKPAKRFTFFSKRVSALFHRHNVLAILTGDGKIMVSQSASLGGCFSFSRRTVALKIPTTAHS